MDDKKKLDFLNDSQTKLIAKIKSSANPKRREDLERDLKILNKQIEVRRKMRESKVD
jgi:hypothetical protein